MTDAEPLARIRFDLQELERRVRNVEGHTDPMGSQFAHEFRELQTVVSDINLNGASGTRLNLLAIEKDLTRLWREVEEWEKDKRALRRSVLLAAIVAALSLTGGLILLAVQVAIRA